MCLFQLKLIKVTWTYGSEDEMKCHGYIEVEGHIICCAYDEEEYHERYIFPTKLSKG